MKTVTNELREECYAFLYALRRTGATNMFGAGPYLEKAYPELTAKQCREILLGWMKSFDESRA